MFSEDSTLMQCDVAVIGCIVPDILKGCTAFIFRVKQSK